MFHTCCNICYGILSHSSSRTLPICVISNRNSSLPASKLNYGPVMLRSGNVLPKKFDCIHMLFKPRRIIWNIAVFDSNILPEDVDILNAII